MTEPIEQSAGARAREPGLADLIRRHPAPQWIQAGAEPVLLEVSHAAASLLGVQPGDLLGRPVRALLDAVEHTRFDAGELVRGGRWRLRPAVGSAIDVEVRTAPCTWGGTDALLVVLSDTRSPAEVEDALRASQLSFRRMAENVPGALFRYLQRPDGRSSVIYMSPRCVELWELEPHVIEQDASQLWAMVDPEDRPAMEASVWQSAQTLAPWYWEWRITTPSGRRKWLQGTGRPEALPDGSIVWDSFILDVTERHRYEEEQRRLRAELRRAQQLEALGRLAGGIAHDFNNVLTVILGYGEALAEALGPGHPSQPDIAELVSAARRSAGLTRQLLAFSRRQVSVPVVVDLATRLNEGALLLDRLIGDMVELEYDLAPGTRPVLIDPVQFDQVVTNLVLNARDAMPEGGTIRLRLADEGDAVELSVADEGVGMDAETLARIFEPFFSTKAEGTGTGLGLSTVYGIVQQAGGTVTVRSAPGQGSCFTVRLPAASQPASAVPAAEAPAPGPAAPLAARVLVCEDEPQLRRFVARVLSRAGASVRVAEGPEQALLLASAEPPDLLLTDVVMAGGGGVELVRRLRARLPLVRVLYMTGYLANEQARVALERGTEPLLPKPFSSDQLVAAVRAALARGAFG